MEELSFNQDFTRSRNSFSERDTLVKEDDDVKFLRELELENQALEHELRSL
jgi:hypothetical protein